MEVDRIYEHLVYPRNRVKENSESYEHVYDGSEH